MGGSWDASSWRAAPVAQAAFASLAARCLLCLSVLQPPDCQDFQDLRRDDDLLILCPGCSNKDWDLPFLPAFPNTGNHDPQKRNALLATAVSFLEQVTVSRRNVSTDSSDLTPSPEIQRTYSPKV